MEGRGRSHETGLRLVQRLADLGLDIYTVPLDAEAGVAEVTARTSVGQMKVLATLRGWLSQYRMFRRNDKLDLVERDDHLMRATALMAIAGPEAAIIENRATSEGDSYDWDDVGWSGRQSATGY
jgi:hypothetical protein